MATIEDAIVTRLTGHAGLSALISDRVEPVLAEKSTMPAVTYRRISTPREESHQGPSGLAYPRFEFSCWATTRAGAIAVAAQLRFCLHAFTGTVDGIRIDAILAAGEHDFYDPETKRHLVISDWTIEHAEATS